MDRLCCFCLVLLCDHARLFVDALWLPSGSGVVLGCVDILIFALFLTLNKNY